MLLFSFVVFVVVVTSNKSKRNIPEKYAFNVKALEIEKSSFVNKENNNNNKRGALCEN